VHLLSKTEAAEGGALGPCAAALAAEALTTHLQDAETALLAALEAAEAEIAHAPKERAVKQTEVSLPPYSYKLC